MIFHGLIDKVLSYLRVMARTKTQTWRPAKKGDTQMIGPPSGGVTAVYRRDKHGNLRKLWQVGQTYAVQPGRGQTGVARIRLMSIRRCKASKLTEGDLIREGFIEELVDGRTRMQRLMAVLEKFYGGDAPDMPGWSLGFEVVEERQ